MRFTEKGKNLTGEKFGKLTVIDYLGKDDKGNNLWNCKCECGGSKITNTHALLSKHTTSCGCIRTAEDFTGRKIGRLTVVKRVDDTFDKSGRRYVTWECICDCGNVTYTTTNNLRGKTTSCGCYLKEVAGQQTHKHGYRKTRLYRIYNNMKQRCNNPNIAEYKNYGGRGIKVCAEWNAPDGLAAFAKWALSNGYKPNLTIERINVNGNYEPSNCTWIPQSEQAKNTTKNVRIEYKGKTYILADIAKVVNIDRRVIGRELKKGKGIDEIVARYGK